MFAAEDIALSIQGGKGTIHPGIRLFAALLYFAIDESQS